MHQCPCTRIRSTVLLCCFAWFHSRASPSPKAGNSCGVEQLQAAPEIKIKYKSLSPKHSNTLRPLTAGNGIQGSTSTSKSLSQERYLGRLACSCAAMQLSLSVKALMATSHFSTPQNENCGERHETQWSKQAEGLRMTLSLLC
ncbi:hypothetical protein ABKN59_006413 [Abortiporus biennis]